MTREERESLLKQATIARFCSLNPNGTVHATPVSIKYRDGQIALFTPSASRKARNVRHNPNVTLLIDTSEGWKSKGLIVYGRAEMEKLGEDTFGIAVSVSETFVPKQAAKSFTRGLMKLTEHVIITVRPEHTASFDYAKDKGTAQVYRAATQKGRRRQART